MSTFLLLINCSTQNSSVYKIKTNLTEYRTNDTLKIEIISNKMGLVPFTDIYIDSTKIIAPFHLSGLKLGKHQIRTEFSIQGKKINLNKEFILFADAPPDLYSYEIVNYYPHDKTSYTQGLEFSLDTLYESTGLKGQSKIRSVDYKSGIVINEKKLNDNYFGEGLSILNNKVYQLTWQENIGFIYNKDLSEVKGSFSYNNSSEGWGLCNDGKNFYKSDGTNKIWILDSNKLSEIDYIEVMTNNKAINKINELEWVNGKIYANTYQFDKEVVLIINPSSGMVEGVIDFSGLKEKVEQIDSLNVLNGIAYNKKTKTFFITGKNWNTLFEVKIFKVNE
jgi:glutaminyl-peptide cyclotransferase